MIKNMEDNTNHSVGDKIMYKNHMGKWKRRKILSKEGPSGREYKIQNERGNTLKRNRIHLIKAPKTNIPMQAHVQTSTKRPETKQPQNGQLITIWQTHKTSK